MRNRLLVNVNGRPNVSDAVLVLYSEQMPRRKESALHPLDADHGGSRPVELKQHALFNRTLTKTGTSLDAPLASHR